VATIPVRRRRFRIQIGKHHFRRRDPGSRCGRPADAGASRPLAAAAGVGDCRS